MIFSNNTTSLGSMDIPMAEGYDSTIGGALALVESARNDMKMFTAMLDVDAREISMRESAYVNEAEIAALNEAAISGIFTKIKELLTKLVAKIKAIFHTFMSKINSLFLTDKQMVNKYGKEVVRKTNLDKMEVKWAKLNGHGSPLKTKLSIEATCTDFDKHIKECGKGATDDKKDSTERIEEYLKKVDSSFNDKSSFAEDYNDYWFDDVDTMELKDTDASSGRGLVTYLQDCSKEIRKREQDIRKINNNIDKAVKEIDKKANDLAKKSVGDDDEDGKKYTDESLSTAQKEANTLFEWAKAFQDATLMVLNGNITAVKKEYKQYKAAFMKAIAANDKKLEESAIYLDAVAEAAEQEVTDVLDKALSKEEISRLVSAASKNVADEGVSDDYDKLVYDNNQYVGRDAYAKAANESALFSEPLY